MLLTFHFQKWQNITDAAICSYLQYSHNESRQAPVFLFASFPFIAQHDSFLHKLKQTQFRCILSLGDSPAFEFYLLSFRNTLSVPSSCLHRLWRQNSVLNSGKNTSDDEEATKRKNTTFRTWRKFDIKKHSLLLHRHSQFALHSNNNTL
jgi:hypothetical protein